MKKFLMLCFFSIFFSCEKNIEKKVKLHKKEIYGLLYQEKALYPGLGFEVDTTINVVNVFDPNDSVIHEMFIVNIDVNKDVLIDSILNIENFRNYSIDIFQVDCEPISIYKNDLTLFLSNGFYGKKTGVYQNDRKLNIIKDTTSLFDYVKINKSLVDSIGISVNGSKVIYSTVNKEYNSLEVFLTQDSIVQFNYMYHWDEY